jgi:hypothetical protein
MITAAVLNTEECRVDILANAVARFTHFAFTFAKERADWLMSWLWRL